MPSIRIGGGPNGTERMTSRPDAGSEYSPMKTSASDAAIPQIPLDCGKAVPDAVTQLDRDKQPHFDISCTHAAASSNLSSLASTMTAPSR